MGRSISLTNSLESCVETEESTPFLFRSPGPVFVRRRQKDEIHRPLLTNQGGFPWYPSGCGARKGRERAFTILEVAIYSSLLILLGSPFVTLVLTSTRATAENDTVNKVETENRKGLFRMERDLKRALLTSVSVGNSGLSLTFTPPNGFDGTAAIAGQQVQFQFRPRSGETMNGADDNQNGIVDEGELVRRDMVTGTEVVVATGFNLATSGFAMSGSTITITIESLASVDRRYGTVTVSNSLSISPRN